MYITTTVNNINASAPKQFAYMLPSIGERKNPFIRSNTPVITRSMMDQCGAKTPGIGMYESVYGFTGWKGGELNAETAKTAVIDQVYLDFDDMDDPQKAMIDAAEVAAYLGHTTQWFSGKKGVGMIIHCLPANLSNDLKGIVLRQFVNELADILPEIDTLDYAVIGDLNRVHRIIDTRHQSTRLYAIGLHTRELSECGIEEIRVRAQNPRHLAQNPTPSKWVTMRLEQIQHEIVRRRIQTAVDNHILASNGGENLKKMIGNITEEEEIITFITALEEEHRKYRRLHAAKQQNGIVGRNKEEQWIINTEREIRATGRAGTGNRISEHKARCHLVKFADELGMGFSEICELFRGVDDYDKIITERQVMSLIRRR